MEPQSVVKMQKTGQKHFLVSQKRWLSSGQEILTKLTVKEEVRVKTKKPSEWQKDSIRLLIEEAKIRNNFDDNELALYLGFCTSSFRERKANPQKLTIEKLQILLQLTGKEMKFVETA